MIEPTTICIGTLHDDPTSLAGIVYQAITRGNLTVWASDDGSVFMGAPGAADELPASSIAGTFNVGQSFRDIVDDLRELLVDRAAGGMLG